MRLRHIPEAAAIVGANPLVIDEHTAPAYRGRWREAFAAPSDPASDGEIERPLYLEIGTGRGRFLAALANERPDIDFLGLELREEVLLTALKNADPAPPNLRFLWMHAAALGEAFAPGEVGQIFLNFPDPWPKARHAKRRLTAPAYLELYRTLLSAAGGLRFRTDNQELLAWSADNFQAAGWRLEEWSQDLPVDPAMPLTEYEARWRRLGMPIGGFFAYPNS